MELYGVPRGILYGQNERVDELNNRIQSRQFPDTPLAPNFSSRPILSKYSRFPILGKRENVEIYPKNVHNIATNFSPATQNGPPNGYLSNIDVETNLRNQNVRLGNKEDATTFVPSSNSDLYNVSVPVTQNATSQPHPNLFDFRNAQHDNFRQSHVNPNTGNNLFHNNTRTQLRSL